MLQRRLVGGQRNIYGENKFGDEMKSSVSIYLRREDVGGCKMWEVASCGRWVAPKITIWTQKGKHVMLSAELRKIQKRSSLLVLKPIQKTSVASPNKCIQKVRL